VSLACARLGWAVQDVEVVSTVGRSLERLRAVLRADRRIVVLSAGAETPAAVCALLAQHGFGASEVVVLEQLGGPAERVTVGTGTEPAFPADGYDPLNVIAINCAPAGAGPLPLVPGLPDDSYEHDGQITKREIRAVTLARLAPRPGELLWDVGGGAGSIAIEWLRASPETSAIAVERRADRAARIERNAQKFGVPDLRVVVGSAPEALSGLPAPDAVFVGGGGSDPAVIEACWAALRSGGRLVVNAVTLQTEAAMVARCAQLGGDLTRLEISRAVGLGSFTGWRPQHPVTQWAATK
jgi:precorrin-6Y C5,15-methyltransferase (decarboxylating)